MHTWMDFSLVFSASALPKVPDVPPVPPRNLARNQKIRQLSVLLTPLSLLPPVNRDTGGCSDFSVAVRASLSGRDAGAHASLVICGSGREVCG